MKQSIFFTIGLLFLVLPFANGQDLIDRGKMKLQKIRNKAQIKGLHDTYMGQIVFSHERIPFQDASANAIISAYTLGEELYFREYWNQTMEDAFKESFSADAWSNAVLLYKIYIDGTEVGQHLEYNTSAKEATVTWFTTWGSLFTQEVTRDNYLYNNALLNVLAKNTSIKAGQKAELRLETYIYDGQSKQIGKKMAQGSLQVLFAGDQLQKIKANHQLNANYPACMPAPKMQDAALEMALLKATQAKGWKETHKFVTIRHPDFTLVKNSLTGILEGRTIGAAVSGTYDSRCWYQYFTFYQAHDGKNYQNTWTLQAVGEQITTPCACFNP